MTYYCSECAINWWPSMAKNGCPSCGCGTTRDTKPPTEDVGVLYVVAVVERDRRERVKAFERFYATHLVRQNAV